MPESKVIVFIDASIVNMYLAGENPEKYKDSWVYGAMGEGGKFETPNQEIKEKISKYRNKLINEIEGFKPYNYTLVKKLFPFFDDIVKNYTVILAVGFPAPYEAMMTVRDGREYMIFDVIRFEDFYGAREDFNCHGILTHELLHICVNMKYPENQERTYREELDYLTFNEGIAHALSFAENTNSFKMSGMFNEKYINSVNRLREALEERAPARRKENLVSANAGAFWDKFASISGMFYFLNNPERTEEIYDCGWRGFADLVISGAEKLIAYKADKDI